MSERRLLPLYQHVYSPDCFPCSFYGGDEENLLNNQDLCYLLITSFFLTTFMFD